MTITIDGTATRGDWRLRVAGIRVEAAITAVIGANGAGKTSLGRLVAGLDTLREGRLVIGDEPVDEPAAGVFVPARRRRVAVVFSDLRLFGHLDALDEVAFGMRRRGVGRRPARARAAELLEAVGLPEGLWSARPEALSGGRRQRVAIARALACEPEVLVADEPLASIDEAGRSELRGLLRDLAGRCVAGRGVAGSGLAGRDLAHVLLISHDPVDVMTLADEVLVLDRGSSVAHGPLGEVAGAPGCEWAAAFLGANVIAGVARGSTVTTPGGFELTVATLAEGPVHVIFPAHAVTLGTAPPDGSARNSWLARVVRSDSDGIRVRVVLSGPIELRADVTPHSADELGLVPGKEVWASVKATELAISSRTSSSKTASAAQGSAVAGLAGQQVSG